jgi:hypothetical protein
MTGFRNETRARIRSDECAKLVHRGITRSNECGICRVVCVNAAFLVNGFAMRETALEDAAVDPELVARGYGESQLSSYENFFAAAS